MGQWGWTPVGARGSGGERSGVRRRTNPPPPSCRGCRRPPAPGAHHTISSPCWASRDGGWRRQRRPRRARRCDGGGHCWPPPCCLWGECVRPARGRGGPLVEARRSGGAFIGWPTVGRGGHPAGPSGRRSARCVAPRPRRRTRRQNKWTQPSISSLSLGPCQEPKARAQQRMALRPQRGQSGRRAQANRHAAPAAATVYFVDSCRPCGGLTAAAGGGNAPGRPACPPRGRRRQLGDAASAGGPHVRFRAPRAYTEYGPAVHCHDRVHPSGVPTGGPLGWWLPLPALCGSHPCWLARPRNAPPLCARKLHVRRAHRVPVGAGGGATILAAAVLGSPPLARVRSAGGAAAAPARTRRATPLCWHVAAPRHRGPDTPSPSLCFRNGQGG